MASVDLVLAGCVALVALAPGLARLGWGTRRAIAWAGWGIGAGAIVTLGAHAGAWGIAVGVVAGLAAAMALVFHAAWQSQPVPAGRERRKAAPPAVRTDRALPRRLAAFLLAGPGAFGVALWFAHASQALARRGGPPSADSLALALFLAPVIWMMLMVWQMMEPGPVRMLRPLLWTAIAGLALWSLT